MRLGGKVWTEPQRSRGGRRRRRDGDGHAAGAVVVVKIEREGLCGARGAACARLFLARKGTGFSAVWEEEVGTEINPIQAMIRGASPRTGSNSNVSISKHTQMPENPASVVLA